MSFITLPTKQEIESKPILVINTCPDIEGVRTGKPFPTAQLSVFEQCLHLAGLTRGNVAILNLFPESVTTSTFWQDSSKPSKRYFKPAAQSWLDLLQQRIKELKPSVIIPLGEIPCKAVLNRSDYTQIRGYPFQLAEDRICIPSLSPKDMIWSNYEWRFYLSNDLKRAKDIVFNKAKITEPNLYVPHTFEEAKALLQKLLESPLTPVAFDIEISNYEVSCIGFSKALDFAFSVPIDDRWSLQEEIELWSLIALVLESTLVKKVTQNGIFDTYFLAYKMGIFAKNIEDTMIAHSIAYPDFLKGLGFLGSIHTWYTYWKDQSPHKSIKKED